MFPLGEGGSDYFFARPNLLPFFVRTLWRTRSSVLLQHPPKGPESACYTGYAAAVKPISLKRMGFLI